MHKGQAVQAYIYFKMLEKEVPNDQEFGERVRAYIKRFNKV